jgi:hypothetical protein
MKKRRVNKMVLGFAAVLASAVVGTTGLAAAHGMGNGHGDKPSKEQCVAAGFKNYGQCVKEWAHHKNHPGSGYGGGYGGHENGHDGDHEGNQHGNDSHNTTVASDVGVTVNGNNNVITVIINFFRR